MDRSKQSNSGRKEPLISETPPALFGGIDMDNLPRRKPGMLTGGMRNGELQIIARKHALELIHVHGQEDSLIEVCGVLAGDVYRDDMGPYLLISDIVQGLAAHSGLEQVAFTPEAWSHIYKAMDRDFPRLRIVGWYHTHPGHGIFLSEVDLFLHDNFFDLPWQAALVHDPKSGQDGIFGWQNGAIRRSNYLIETDAPAPVMVPVSEVPPACIIESAPAIESAAVIEPEPVMVAPPVVVEAAAVIEQAPVVVPAPEMVLELEPVGAPAPQMMPEPVVIPELFMELAPEIEPVAPVIEPPAMVIELKPEETSLAVPKAYASGFETVLRVTLTLVGLALFIITGLLAGLLIQQFHLTLPHWPNNKWPG